MFYKYNKRAREKSKVGIQVWRDIPGYEGIYRISNLGKIKSLARIVPHKTGGRLTLPARTMKTPVDSQGYKTVNLRKLGKGGTKRVHWLILLAFDGPMPDKYKESRHKDDDKLNNVLHNLKYGTRSANRQDALRNGRTYLDPNKPVGEASHFAVLTEREVRKIKRFTPSKRGDLTRLAERFKVSPTTITDIRSGRNWAHVEV